MRALRLIYRVLWWLAVPVAVARLWLRGRKEPGYRAHIGERFGRHSQPTRDDGRPLLWVHAVSVGETRAAGPLIDALLAAHPDLRILLTHMTPSGRATGEQLFGDRVLRAYLPYDMPGPVRRFLAAYRPLAGVVMETEVWPTLLDECRRAGVPMILANARMSERSWRRAARFGAAAREVFGGWTRVFAQSAADSTRLSDLGARQVTVFGNLKFDMTPPAELLERGRAWRATFGGRPVWVAASTREGEEVLVLEAFRQVTCRDALLILVPRHPQRFEAIAEQLTRGGWTFVRRSSWDGVSPLDAQVLLGDSMGELAAYYAAAELAFIGGSLLPLGGQNLIEACAVGVPVLIGPHMFNFAQASADALTAGAALRVADAAALGAALSALFQDSPRRIAMGEAGRAFAAQHRGATDRTVRALNGMIDQ